MGMLEKRAKKVLMLLYFLCTGFVVFLVYESGTIRGLSAKIDQEAAKDCFNQEKREVAEGRFLDRNGEAVTGEAGRGEARKILSPAYSYLIGYNSDIYTLSGLRKVYRGYLYKGGKDQDGAAIQLTTDNALMSYAYGLLKEKGCITVLDSSGAILAMVSRDTEDFDANNIDRNWEKYNKKDAFLFDRNLIPATPGSTFKIVTASCAVEEGFKDYTWEDKGLYMGIHNAGDKQYGKLDMEEAFAHSVNTYFASLGVKEGKQALSRMCSRYHIGEDLVLDFTTLHSNLDFKGGTEADIAQVAFGAGETKITPVHLAAICSAVCTGNGIMPQPYVVESIFDDGKTKYTHQPDSAGVCVSEHTADAVKKLMKAAASSYGLTKSRYGTTVYAKTGTAQLTDDRENYNTIWLAASTEKYTIVICYDESDQSSHSLIRPMGKLIEYMESR